MTVRSNSVFHFIFYKMLFLKEDKQIPQVKWYTSSCARILMVFSVHPKELFFCHQQESQWLLAVMFGLLYNPWLLWTVFRLLTAHHVVPSASVGTFLPTIQLNVLTVL